MGTYSWKIYTDVAGVQYWYDRHVRVWYAARVDAEGNLGPSVDAYHKQDIVAAARQLGLEHLIDLYETAILAGGQEEIDRLCLAVEAAADATGYNNHRRLMALHTMAEGASQC